MAQTGASAGGKSASLRMLRGNYLAGSGSILIGDLDLTASLDAANRPMVIDLISEGRARGASIVGIFHGEAA